ncbi:MAG: DMT family transporter [Candidatus Babeliales bacterium]
MKIKDILLFSVCIFFISLNYISGKFLSEVPCPAAIVLLRFLISSLLFLPFVSFSSVKEITRKDFLLIIVSSFFGVFAYNYLFFMAVKCTLPINISLVNALIPFLTLIYSAFIFNTKPTWKEIVLFCMSLIGIVFVITKGNFNLSLFKTFKGELYMLAGASCWVFYGFVIRAISKTIPTMTITFLTGLSGLVFLALFSLVGNIPLFTIPVLKKSEWLAIAYIGSFGTAGVFFLYNLILKYFTSKKTNLIVFSSVPITVACISAALLNQTLNEWQLSGGVLILASILPMVLQKD